MEAMSSSSSTAGGCGHWSPGDAGAGKPGPYSMPLGVDDIKAELDQMRHKLLDVRSDLDYLKASLRQREAASGGVVNDVAKSRSELREAQAAVSVHESELAALARASQASQAALQDLGRRFETAWARADEVHSEVHGELRELRVFTEGQAAQLQKDLERGLEGARAHIDRRAAEYRNLALDDRTTELKELETLRARQDEAMAQMAELGTGMAGVREVAQQELCEARSALEEQGKALQAGQEQLQANMRADAQALLEKQTRCAAELHRLVKALEGQFQTAGSEHSEAQRKLEEDCLGRHAQLRDAVEAQQSAAARHAEEACTALAARLEAAEAATPDMEALAQRSDGIAARVDEVASTCLEVSRCADERLEDSLRALKEGLREDLRLAAVDLTKRCSEAAKEAQGARGEARDAREACRELAHQTCSQFQRQAANVEEQQSRLRFDLDRGLAGLKGALGTSQDEQRLAWRRHDEAVAAQEARQSSEVAALRSHLVEQLGGQEGQAAKLEERWERRLQEALAELRAALCAQGEQLCSLRAASTDASAQAELHLRRHAEQEVERMAASLKRDLTGCVEEAVAAAVHQQEDQHRQAALEQQQQQQQQQQPRGSCAGRECSAKEAAEEESSTRGCRSAAVELAEVQAAVGSLAAGLVRVGQCCGLLGGLDSDAGRQEEGSFGGEAGKACLEPGLRELLAWERDGHPLAMRILRSWEARSGARSLTLFDLVRQKADAEIVRELQTSTLDLEGRLLAKSKCTQAGIGIEGGTYIGEPYQGPFGSSSLHTRKAEGGEMLVPTPPAAQGQRNPSGRSEPPLHRRVMVPGTGGSWLVGWEQLGGATKNDAQP